VSSPAACVLNNIDNRPCHSNRWPLCGDFALEEFLERLAILGELLDTLVELIEGHLVLEEGPAELWLVVDVGNLGDGVGLGSYKWIRTGSRAGVEWNKLRTDPSVESPRNGIRGFLEFLEESRGNSEEVDTGEGFDLANLRGD